MITHEIEIQDDDFDVDSLRGDNFVVVSWEEMAQQLNLSDPPCDQDLVKSGYKLRILNQR